MEKAYIINEIKLDNKYLSLKVDGHAIKLKLYDISQKLSNANEQEINDYTISPSGYGINWISLDEDLSINGLLKTSKSKHALVQ